MDPPFRSCQPRLRGSCSGALPTHGTSGGDFRLEPQHVTLVDAGLAERLLVEQLFSRGAVVELVADHLAVRAFAQSDEASFEERIE